MLVNGKNQIYAILVFSRSASILIYKRLPIRIELAQFFTWYKASL